MFEETWKPAQPILSDEYDDETVEEPEFECRICLELPTEPCVSRCGHLFCRRCLVQWLDFSPKCPACKTPSSMKDVVPMFVTTSRASRSAGSPIRSRAAPRIIYASSATQDLSEDMQMRYRSTKPCYSDPFLSDPSHPASAPSSPHFKGRCYLSGSQEIPSSGATLLPLPHTFRFFADEAVDEQNSHQMGLNSLNEDGYLSDADTSSDSLDAGLVTWPTVPSTGNYDFLSHEYLGQQQFSRVLSVVALALMVTALLPSK
ncbi:hypothetical protein FRC02_000199 [Tulasnella sp. 418]|nr:hypothetical protein FRC02_000199 [Tulasnella sp. 418]